MFAHARHQAPLAVDCPRCPARVGHVCRSKNGTPCKIHGPRVDLLEGLTDAVRDQLVEMVATLKWMRRLAGGVESKAMQDVIGEIGAVIAAARSSVAV